MPIVRIPTPLRPHTGGLDRVEAAGSTVGEILAGLGTQYPALRERLFDGDELRRFVNVYVNDEDIRHLGGPQAPVRPGDTLSIVPSVAGGTPGLIEGNPGQVINQAEGIAIVIVYDVIVSLIILKLVDLVIGLRVSADIEREGLDITLHGEAVQ